MKEMKPVNRELLKVAGGSAGGQHGGEEANAIFKYNILSDNHVCRGGRGHRVNIPGAK